MKTIMVTGGRGMLGHAVEQVVGEEPRAGYRFEFVDIEEGDLTVPFGGVKQSGFGRDKSLHALDKFTDLKTTWIELS